MDKMVGLILLISVLLFGTCFAEGFYSQKREISCSSIDVTKNGINESIDFLIITPEKFKTNLESLKIHKDQKGIRTKIITLNEIYTNVYFHSYGRDNAEHIKIFLYQAKQTWSIQYVMLVGGIKDIPVRYVDCIPSISSNNDKYPYYHNHFQNNPIDQYHFISDLYFADLTDEQGIFCNWDSNNNSLFGEVRLNEIIDEMDLSPDIFIGRVLCETSEDVENLVQKIIIYENSAYKKPWFQKFITIGGDTHAFIFSELMSRLIDKSVRIAWEGEYLGNLASSYLKDFAIEKIFASGIFHPSYTALTTENINNAINDGAGFVLFSGHGFSNTFGTHPPFTERVWLPYPNMYSSDDVKSLVNEEKLPVVIFNACLCGAFDTNDDSIAWEMINQRKGGSIASFACTTLSYGPPSTLFEKYGNGYLCLELLKTYAEGERIIGKLWQHSIKEYLNDESIWDETTLMPLLQNHITIKQWIYFGDPSLKIGGYEV